MKKKSDQHPKSKIKNYFTTSGKTEISIIDLAGLLGYTTGQFNERLKISKKSKKETISFDFLVAIYTVTGITPKEMGITLEQISGNRIDIDTSFNPNFLEIEEVRPIFNSYANYTSQENGSSDDYTHEYLQNLVNKLNTSKNSILVYDYFMNNPRKINQDDRKKFFSGYENYFISLENLSEKKNLKYTRILSLPLHSDRILDKIDADNKWGSEIKAIYLLFTNTYEHILKCYKKFGDRFELYITDRPSRSFSIMIIDEEYLVSEYYRIRPNKMVVPDILFIEKAYKENHTAIMLESYHREFQKVCKYKIDFSEFQHIQQDLTIALKKLIDSKSLGGQERYQLEKKIKLISEINSKYFKMGK